MKKVSISLDSEHVALLDDRQEDDDIDSRSAAVRDILDEYSELRTEYEEVRTECEQLRTTVDDREQRIEELEAELEEHDQLKAQLSEVEQELERVKNEKRLILEEREEKSDLVDYVEQERTAEQRWREASMATRMKWKVFGMPSDSSTNA